MFPKAPKARTVYHLNKILVTINYSVHSPCIPQKTLKLYLYKPLRNSEAAPTLWNLGTSLPPQLLRPASQILCRLASQAEKKTSAELKPGVCLAVDSLFSVCDAAVKKKKTFIIYTPFVLTKFPLQPQINYLPEMLRSPPRASAADLRQSFPLQNATSLVPLCRPADLLSRVLVLSRVTW